MSKDEILQSCKYQLKIHIETLLELGLRPSWIEIELLHHMKKLLREERH